MFSAFIDLEKAYDKVWRVDLWSAMKEHGIGGSCRLLRSIEALYKESKTGVRVEGELMEEFGVKQGLRQKCPLSPWLYISLDRVLRKAMVEFKGESDVRQLPHMNLVADDTV